MAAHLAEVLVWSFAYSFISIAPPGTDLVYFAFVNYTTLGYGDVTPLERWHLLGPMAAMNGMLLFGWSTAVIFEVLRRTMTAPAANRNSACRSMHTRLSAEPPSAPIDNARTQPTIQRGQILFRERRQWEL